MLSCRRGWIEEEMDSTPLIIIRVRIPERVGEQSYLSELQPAYYCL